jgi:hypothetical protein
MSRVRNPEIMKLFIRLQSLSLCLMGYVWLGQAPLEESLEVVCRWLCLTLDAAYGDRDVLHVRVVLLFVIIIVIASCGCDLVRMLLPPLLSALDVLLGSLDGVTLLLLRIASLPPRMGRGLAASLLVVYWEMRLCHSSVVYLKKSFFARKGGGYCVHALGCL